MDKIELLGSACFSHGPYTFYKAVRIGNGRILRLGSFFLTKLWSDADLVSIGELQLLWIDSRGPNTPLASLRLYFLPENTPDGRRDTHGEDEVLTISEKVVVRVHDLVTWLSPSLEWSWGREVSYPSTPSSSPESSPRDPDMLPQVLTDPGIDFSDVEKQQKEFENTLNGVKKPDPGDCQTRVVVLSYPRYCRYRALLRRLEGSEPSWLASSVAAALGGFTALPGTRVLFCRDTFDYPDLETHELLCNHLAPKLKGRPRRKRKKRSASPGESSNESEASVASTSKSVGTLSSSQTTNSGRPSGVRRSERKTTAEEKKFITDVQNFMNSRGTPVGKMPLLGYRQIDLYLFYSKVQMLGGYDSVSAGRLWKSIYDDIGGNTASTSAATITRRHYERLLLPYERYQRGDEVKLKPNLGRRMKMSNTSDEVIEVKQETENNYPEEASPTPAEATSNSSTNSSSNSNSNLNSSPNTNSSANSNSFSNANSTTVTPPPVQSIISTTPFLPGDKPRSDSGKMSSLRSVRVKPERLKSLNTIIAGTTTTTTTTTMTPKTTTTTTTTTMPSTGNVPPAQPPSPALSSNTSTSTPSSTPSTTPTNGSSQSALERQLNASLLVSHQVAPSSSPSTPPTVVTLTPPPEKDMKDIKLDTKQTNLIAQGKENIPLYDEKPIYVEKMVTPRSPEVIDLESEGDKLIIPSFKKRKLEILREGGLEVTAVELDTRPSVIQPQVAPPPTPKVEEKLAQVAQPSVTTPKLISVTVTPDIGHMLPSRSNNINNNVVNSNNNNSNVNSNNNLSNNSNSSNSTNSRVINVGNSGNALLQLYASAGVSRRFPASTPPGVPSVAVNGRQIPPRVTQSRSIFAHNEKTVYGNPKEILVTPKYGGSGHQPGINLVRGEVMPSGVLDLTQKQTFSRPNLEIVRVPVVPRPSPLNLDTKSSHGYREKPSHHQVTPLELPRKNHFPVSATYTNVLDGRTMASNNLEITLVSPKKASPAPIRPNSVGSGTMSPHRKTPQPSVNDKFVSAMSRSEPVSPYTPRKTSHPVVIPNVPNLSQLNSVGGYGRTAAPSVNLDKRKADHSRDHHHRRTSEGEKSMVAPPDSLRRHSMPSAFVPPGVVTNGPGGSAFLAPQPPPPPHPGPPQMPTNSPNKFLPLIDPMYYSAFYNGLLPTPMVAAAAAANPFLPPEFSAYYKELLAPSQSRLAITGQSPTVPTSK